MQRMLEFENYNERKDLLKELYKNRPMFMEAHKFFHKTLHDIKFSTFIDIPLSIACGKPMLEVCKFDDWLHCKFGEYEKEGMSMKDVLVKNYGAVVAWEIERLVG
jgi:hypothetical protein